MLKYKIPQIVTLTPNSILGIDSNISFMAQR